MARRGVNVRINTRLFNQSEEKLAAASTRTLQKVAMFGTRKAKHFAPYQTGHLRRSIHPYDMKGTRGKYGSNLRYARIRELGGVIKPKKPDGYLIFKVDGQWVKTKKVKQKGTHYLRRSAIATQKAVPRLARQSIRELGL